MRRTACGKGRRMIVAHETLEDTADGITNSTISRSPPTCAVHTEIQRPICGCSGWSRNPLGALPLPRRCSEGSSLLALTVGNKSDPGSGLGNTAKLLETLSLRRSYILAITMRFELMRAKINCLACSHTQFHVSLIYGVTHKEKETQGLGTDIKIV